MSHIWSSKGDMRTIVIEYQPSEIILRYLQDMREALKMAMAYAYVLAEENEGRVSNPIALRRKIKPWFYSRYDYARHHINPVCRSAIAMLRSYRKRHKCLAIPEVNKLAMRIDSELFKLEVNSAQGCPDISIVMLFSYRVAISDVCPSLNQYAHFRTHSMLEEAKMKNLNPVSCLSAYTWSCQAA